VRPRARRARGEDTAQKGPGHAGVAPEPPGTAQLSPPAAVGLFDTVGDGPCRYGAAVTPVQAMALARDEAAAHARLLAAWLPVVRRLGDDWSPQINAPKATLAAPFMALSGTSGFIDPFSLESQLAPDLLWFEQPFSLAHEWSHVAGYNREDEANYIAIVTCLRDRDAIAQYSGWLELFLSLPPRGGYAKRTFVPLVWQDFAALRERNARHINVTVSRMAWRPYDW